MEKKDCTKCGKTKHIAMFWHGSSYKGKRYYQSLCKSCAKKAKRISYLKKPEIYREQRTKWRKENIERAKENARKYTKKLKIEAMSRVCGNETIKCNCCDETEIKFLCIDHVNNDGKEDRKKYRTDQLYAKIKKMRSRLKMYQVLCYNCNMAKAFFRICPHYEFRENKKETS